MAELTTNKNYLVPGQYKLTIDKTKYPNVEYFCNALTVPGISTGPAEAPFRNNRYAESGDTIEFSELTLTFLIDEDLNNYFELWEWIYRNAKELDKTDKSDAIVSILTSHSNVNKQLKFIDVFPINISDIEFSSINTDVEYITATASFRYSYFELL